MVTKFKYLGSVFTANNDCFQDAKARIGQGWACVDKLGSILRSRITSYKAKLRIYLSVIRPVVLYGGQTWVLSHRCVKRLEGFENSVLQRIVGPEVRDGVVYYRSNEEVQLILKYPQSIVRAVQTAALHWAGHILGLHQEPLEVRVASAIHWVIPKTLRQPSWCKESLITSELWYCVHQHFGKLWLFSPTTGQN